MKEIIEISIISLFCLFLEIFEKKYRLLEADTDTQKRPILILRHITIAITAAKVQLNLNLSVINYFHFIWLQLAKSLFIYKEPFIREIYFTICS